MMGHQEILERCKGRDSRAQRALFDLFKARLMGLCRRYAKDRDDAQDMVQETFIKIFSKIDQVSSPESLEAWMKSIAVHTAIDHYKRKQRKEMMIAPEDVSTDVADTAYEGILDNLTDEYLLQIINDLPDGCRVIFNLAAVEGYHHHEIANMLGITESTSRSQLHYAKELLKEKLIRLGIKRYEKLA